MALSLGDAVGGRNSGSSSIAAMTFEQISAKRDIPSREDLYRLALVLNFTCTL
jgi:hypothetical protein